MAQYLPVLLVSVSAVSTATPAPDDSALDTQAVGQVDYLSHNWQEEDIAKSWRNMTRRKDSIANGARLENASWRTWWKQRNNLPTVSPERLNWLKDSDVTWLYGPLHTAADWVPPRHSFDRGGGVSSPASPSLSSVTLHPSPSPRSNSPWSLKPILKHRSISELLSISLPPSPGSESLDLSDEHDAYFGTSSVAVASLAGSRPVREAADREGARKRPKLAHTKSDSNVHQRNPFRGDSPPLPLVNGAAPVPLPLASRDSSCGDSNASTQKRHISFNTFVEQCIAIEKPNEAQDDFYGTVYEDEEDRGANGDEDGYREDDEQSDGNEEEDESDDDMLEMRPSPRSRSSSSRRAPSLSGASSSTASGWTPSDGSVEREREHATIAPIAPTLLKTSASSSPAGAYFHGGYGNPWEEEEEEAEMELFASERQYVGASANTLNERSDSVSLVYVPPHGSLYAERIANGNGHAGGAKAFGLPLSPPPHAAAMLRAASFDDVDMLASRSRVDVEADAPFGSGFDFFSGPDMGGVEDYSIYRTSVKRIGRSPAQSHNSGVLEPQSKDVADATAQAEETLSTGHSKGSSGSVSEEGTIVPSSLTPPPSPRTRREEESPSPVPSAAIPVPRHAHANQSPSPVPSSTSTGTSSTSTVSSTSTGTPSTTSGASSSSYSSPYLEPPPRGRSASPVTTPSGCNDSGRGRGGARGSSLSDRDRSGREKDEREAPRGRSRSRSSAGSPLEGSVSPRSGSHSRLGPGARRASIDGGGAIGFGGYGATYGRRDKSVSPEDDGGTAKNGRVKSRLKKTGHDSESSSSVSPPSTVREKGLVDQNGATTHSNLRNHARPSDRGTFQHVEDTDVSRSLNPTPSNSPTSSFRPLAPSSVPPSAAPSIPSVVTPSHSSTSSEDSATLVGRAADIVSSAKGYLGSFWGAGERQLAQPSQDASAMSGTR